MSKSKLMLIVIFLSWSWSTTPDFINEVLHYSVGFRFFSAGNATLSMKSDTLDDKMVYLLTSTIKTNSFLSNFYKIRDEIKSWLLPENLSLIKTVQNIREGRYRRNHNVIILGDSLAISKNRTFKIPGNVYDPIAFVYFLRKQKLIEGNQYSFFAYGHKKINEISVHVTGKELIKVPKGTYNCYKIEPFSTDGKPLLKNNGIMRVWLSEDSLHLPIKIEQNTNLGTIVLQLTSITH